MFQTLRNLSPVLASLTLIGTGLCAPSFAAEQQLEGTAVHGAPAATEAALAAADGVLRIVNGFKPADMAGDLAPVAMLADAVYATDADVFRSQEFIAKEDFGGAAFLKALGFLNDVLGEGTSYLAPVQVCAIYAFVPAGEAGAVDFVMTTEAMVPKFGQVVNTVLVKTRETGDGRRITYHDYLAAPAGGEDCNGPAAAAAADEWLPKVQ